MIWRFMLLVAVLVTSTSVSTQSTPTLEQVLDRMSAYLVDYESQLSSVVADEKFTQNISANGRRRSTNLESEVAFIRLPGGAEWLGFRDVRKADYKNVASNGISIGDVLTSAAGDMTKAHAIAQASARYNLGLPRTVNVPTAPLDIIHPRHRAAHKYELLGRERVRGTPTVIVGFVEVARPTLVKEPSGKDLISSGRIWIAPETGAVWRAEWIYQAEYRAAGAPPPPGLRVDFAPHDLGCLVPTAMTEVFAVPVGRGEGRATYRNFRRFGTSARIVPHNP